MLKHFCPHLLNPNPDEHVAVVQRSHRDWGWYRETMMNVDYWGVLRRVRE